MKAHARALALCAALAALLAAGCEEKGGRAGGAKPGGEKPPPPPPPVKTVKAGAHRLSGPYTHRNLTVFLIHGADRIKGKKFITLKGALEQKKAAVHETGNVQKLSIENLSADEILYVQSGDIVKGGKQDRVIQHDFIVGPRSGKVPISSFCVEQGRWTRRGAESSKAFGSSMQQVAGKNLKLAARLKGNQGMVWKAVAESQIKLATSVGAPVKDARSASSMQLTLENKKVQESLKEYKDKLARITEGKKNVIGFAFAINGKVNSADVYAAEELFRKLWPKLLESAATEAVAEFRKEARFKPAAAEAVKTCLEEAGKGKASEKQISKRVRMTTRKGKGVYGFTTRDEKLKVNIHDSMLAE